MRIPILIASWLLLAASLTAQHSPVGLWRTFDEDTGEPKSLVRIAVDENGTLTGAVEEILIPDRRDSVCKACKGERRNQPIRGMTILWAFEKSGSKWTNGEILDPENGKIYSAYLKPKNQGQSLEVRGYIGVSLIGRSQAWQRVE